MSKDKEDSGFGFKDKAKALDTLRLLEEHDMNYRKLTVRGLLGRAKRVLSLTKAEEKIKNIKEAMEVFETWLAENGKDKDSNSKKESKKETDSKKDKESNKDTNEDKDDDKPSETVPGLGYKDALAAEGTLAALEGRDPQYQWHAVKGLIGSAERTLTRTKDEAKIANMKAAVEIFKKFLEDYGAKNMDKHNNAYLSLGIVKTCLGIAEKRNLKVDKQKQFIEAYTAVEGDYKKLRTVTDKENKKTWDIVRNTALKGLKEKYSDSKLFNDKEEPTDDHLQMLLWAYSPEQAKVKKLITETKENTENRKRRSSGHNEEGSKKKKE